MELSEGLRNMANKTKTNDISKEDEILEVGQELIQTVGYDGFSYRDIADRVGIKSASVHYYFPAKTDLACLLYTSPSPRDATLSRMPSSA